MSDISEERREELEIALRLSPQGELVAFGKKAFERWESYRAGRCTATSTESFKNGVVTCADAVYTNTTNSAKAVKANFQLMIEASNGEYEKEVEGWKLEIKKDKLGFCQRVLDERVNLFTGKILDNFPREYRNYRGRRALAYDALEPKTDVEKWYLCARAAQELEKKYCSTFDKRKRAKAGRAGRRSRTVEEGARKRHCLKIVLPLVKADVSVAEAHRRYEKVCEDESKSPYKYPTVHKYITEERKKISR